MSHQGPPPEAVRKLPIFQTVAEAYGMVFSHLPSLAKAAALPFAISLGISFTAQTEAISPERFVLVNALNLFPEAYFGVAWIRFVLLGARRAAPTTLPPIMPRHLHFLRFAALMMLLTALPGLGIMAEYRPLAEFDGDPSPELRAEVMLNMLPFMIMVVVALVLVLRFSFVFPAVAVDEAYGLADSWRHTRGQAIRLIAGLAISMIPMTIASLFLGAALSAGAGAPASPGLVFLVSNMALSYVVLALYFAFVSIAFRECTGWIPAAQAGPPDRATGKEQEG